MEWRFTALLIALLLVRINGAFESDELDDEWGLIGAGSAAPPAAAASVASSKRSDVVSGADSSKVEFPLEHAFGDSEFKPAGSFAARLRPSRGGQSMAKLRLTRLPFSEGDKSAFQELVKSDGFYTVRVPATPLKPGNASVMSSIKARCLVSSNMKERFDFHLVQSNIISVGYSPGSECPYPRDSKPVSRWTFDTNIFSKVGEEASRYIILNEDFGSGDGAGDEAAQLKKLPEKSFWAKYWMYIIPLGLIVMNAVAQVANMQDEQQQGGAAAAPQSHQPAAVAAAPSRPAIRKR